MERDNLVSRNQTVALRLGPHKGGGCTDNASCSFCCLPGLARFA